MKENGILYRDENMEDNFAEQFKRIAGDRLSLRFVEKHFNGKGRIKLSPSGYPVFQYDNGRRLVLGSFKEGEAFLEKVYFHKDCMEVNVTVLDDPKVRYEGMERAFVVAKDESFADGNLDIYCKEYDL